MFTDSTLTGMHKIYTVGLLILHPAGSTIKGIAMQERKHYRKLVVDILLVAGFNQQVRLFIKVLTT